MNSQIFETYQHNAPKNENSTDLTIGVAVSYPWLAAIVLIAVVILFPERPAWGNELDLHIGPGGIRGYAHQVELGDVIVALADEGGYTIYLDEKMKQTRITFNIPSVIPAEEAISRIVRPFSHAIVYTRSANSHHLKIEQIKIYYQNPIVAPLTEPIEAATDDTAADQNPNGALLIAAAVKY